MSSRRFVTVAVSLALLLSTSTVLAAARGKPGTQPMPEGEPITRVDSIKGTIEMSPLGPKIVSGNDSWTIMRANSNFDRVRVMGSANVDYLHAGQLIRFNAMYDKKTNRIKDQLAKLTIFTASPEFSPGMTPDTEVVGAAASGEYKAMVFTGQIKNIIKGNTLHVLVQNLKSPLVVDLAESVTIDLNINDFSVVKQGDTIEITNGKKYLQQKCCTMTEGKITLTEPLAGVTKKKGPKDKFAGKGKDKDDKGAADKPEKPGKKEAPAKKEPAKKDT